MDEFDRCPNVALPNIQGFDSSSRYRAEYNIKLPNKIWSLDDCQNNTNGWICLYVGKRVV